jgi:predicted acylesterase/phospholipase RssA
MAPLRLSLTMPGAVALGAYEGGALAALLVAVQSLGPDVVVVDSIGAASAGSITAVLTAQTLLEAKDPITMMHAAWVERASFESMRERRNDYPLNQKALSDIAHGVLGLEAPSTVQGARRQEEPILASLSLTSLAGLTYDLTDPATPTPGDAMRVATFQDWYNPTFDANTSDWTGHAEVAIASGANAMGFPAKKVNRSSDRETYEEAGLQGFPDDGNFWYTDGGTTNNEPLGRTIDLAQRIGSPDDRLFLLVHYDTGPAGLDDDSPWSGAREEPPPWVRTATRAFHAQSAQSIFDDLKRLQKVNARLEWTRRIAPALVSGIEGAAADLELSEEQIEQLKASIAQSLDEQLRDIRAAKAPKNAHQTDKTKAEPAAAATPAPASLTDVVEALTREATGLANRRHVAVELVSPSIDPADQQRCAGAFMFHFGGFFDERLRENDFDLGYRNMEVWLNRSLGGYLSDAAAARLPQALEEVRTAPDRAKVGRGDGAGVPAPEPGLRDKMKLAEFVGQLGQVILSDAIHGGL